MLIDTKLLRQKILDLAIRGKLVRQDPKDEPASELLKRINAEKAVLVKSGKLKKEKPLPPISGDEIPFDIPGSWTWVRLSQIAFFQNGFAFKSTDMKTTGCIPVVRISNLNGQHVCLDDCLFVSEDSALSAFLIEQGDLLIAMSGATTGKIGIFNSAKKAYLNQRVGNIKLFFKNEYLQHYRDLFVISQQKKILEMAYGGAQPNISGEKIGCLLLPLPPLAEQERIVAKVEALMNEVDTIERETENLNRTFALTREKALDLAIRGKLVPQDPNDEPASELLKRIQAEKASLIKSGKLKKEKTLPPITKDEIPFPIPASWSWVRLGSIITLLSGQDFPPSGYNDRQEGIPYITGASNMDNGKLIVNRWTRTPSSIALQGDLLITCKGAGVGKMALMNIPQAHVARQIMAIRPFAGVNTSFVEAFIQGSMPTVRRQMNGLIPGISREVMLQLIFQLPPLAEQKRIVKKLESILSTLELQS